MAVAVLVPLQPDVAPDDADELGVRLTLVCWLRRVGDFASYAQRITISEDRSKLEPVQQRFALIGGKCIDDVAQPVPTIAAVRAAISGDAVQDHPLGQPLDADLDLGV